MQGIIPQNESLGYEMGYYNNKSLSIPNTTKSDSVTYTLFAENGTSINKDYCANVTTTMSIPIPGNINLTNYQYYADKGINIFDPNDPYFNDRCIPIRKNSTETTILGRRDEYSGVELSCSEGCLFKGINVTTGYLDCDCNLTNAETEVFAQVGNQVLGIISSLNIEIVKCWEVVLSYVKYLINFSLIFSLTWDQFSILLWLLLL